MILPFLRLHLCSARLAWPTTVLVLLLQRTPVVRLLVNADFTAVSRMGQVLRAMLPAVIGLGATHTLTGQTRWTTNPTSPVTGQVGTNLSVVFAFTGGSATPASYAIVGTLPPGMSVPNATGAAGNLTLNSSVGGSVTGTPTSSGSFSVTLTAFDDPNRGAGEHGSSPNFTLDFIIQSALSPPAFSGHPATQTRVVGGTATFTVTATGSPPPSLQWRKDTVALPGQTGSTLTITPVSLADAGSYDCVATSTEGSATSNPATLTVNAPPAFSMDPLTQSVTAGGNVTFTVAATGTPAPTLQWRKDTVALPGETGTSLTINPVAPTDGGVYDCVATNVAGNATSNSATLTVDVIPAFATHPASETVAFRGTVTLTVVATGSPAPTLQWRKDTFELPGETTATLTLTNVDLAADGSYDCVATNLAGSATSNAAVITVTPPAEPVISTQPIAIRSLTGSGAFFSVQAGGVETTYQWRKDGVDLPGETGSSMFVTAVAAGDAGNYSVRVTNAGGFVDSNAVALSVASTGRARLVNMSARAVVGTGGDVLIPGFSVAGAGTKTVLVRAIGPRLVDFGVTGVLADPAMQLFRGSTASEENDDWGLFADQTLLETTRAAVGAFPLDTSSQPLKDSSMVVNFTGGNYTVRTFGVGDTTGVGLVEFFDADPITATARFVNISARAVVGTGGDVLIPGFFIEGDVALTLLIRAVGPTLGGAPFNVPGVLEDPVMTLFRISNTPNPGDQEIMTVNDDWQQTTDVVALEAVRSSSGAFALADGGADGTLLVSLNPGGYTVKVEGKNGTTGVALMEIYVISP